MKPYRWFRIAVVGLCLILVGILGLCLGTMVMLTAPTAPREISLAQYDAGSWVAAGSVAALCIGWALKCGAAIAEQRRENRKLATHC